jgi:hypothetical protein
MAHETIGRYCDSKIDDEKVGEKFTFFPSL